MSGELLCPAGRILAFDQTFILDRTGRAGSLRARELKRNLEDSPFLLAYEARQYSKANTPSLNRRRSLERSIATRVELAYASEKRLSSSDYHDK